MHCDFGYKLTWVVFSQVGGQEWHNIGTAHDSDRRALIANVNDVKYGVTFTLDDSVIVDALKMVQVIGESLSREF